MKKTNEDNKANTASTTSTAKINSCFDKVVSDYDKALRDLARNEGKTITLTTSPDWRYYPWGWEGDSTDGELNFPHNDLNAPYQTDSPLKEIVKAELISRIQTMSNEELTNLYKALAAANE